MCKKKKKLNYAQEKFTDSCRHKSEWVQYVFLSINQVDIYRAVNESGSKTLFLDLEWQMAVIYCILNECLAFLTLKNTFFYH